MPITTTPYVPLSYAGDGVTNAFPVTFDFQFQTELVVHTLNTSNNVSTLLVLGTDYTVSPTLNSPAGTGTVVTTTPPPALTNLLIARVVPLTQETSWVPNDPNLSTSTMNAVDKLTMIVQQLSANPFGLTGTSDQFLRGDNVLTNTLVGPLGGFTLPADTTALFIAGQNADASIKVVGGASSQSAFSFGVSGSANPWDARWVYDPGIGEIGWQFYGGPILGTFDNAGNLSISGTYTGSADGSLITTGTIAPARLGSGSGSALSFLNGLGQFTIPAGGSGINTTTTGTFTIAAVNSTQTVPVTSATGIVIGTELRIADGTHGIIGQVTNIASLNLTVRTDQIVHGTAGNTMASGAAVQAATDPGTNSIIVQDANAGPFTATAINMDGSAVDYVTNGLGVVKIGLENGNVPGGVATLFAYAPIAGLSVENISPYLDPLDHVSPNVGLVSVAAAGQPNAAFLKPTAQYQVPICTGFSGSPTSLAWGLLTANNITTGSLTPPLLQATNSPSAGQIPSYADSTHFTWVANTGLPTATNTGQFLRGDGAYSNVLNLAASGGEAANRLMLAYGVTDGSFGMAYNLNAGGTTASWFVQKRTSGSWGIPTSVTTNYVIGGGLDGSLLSINGTATTIDSSALTENIVTTGMLRTASGVRSVYGPLSKIFEVDMTGLSTITLDLVNGAYQRLTGFTTNVTITLTDTTPLPSNGLYRYAGNLRLEINAPGANTFAWLASGGSIVWNNGAAAPTTFASSGISFVDFERRQGQTVWVGSYSAATGTGTVTSVASGSGLTGGPITTTGTLSIASQGVTASMIANNTITASQISATANIPTTAIAGISSSNSGSLFLNDKGAFTAPSGGGGGDVFKANTQTFTGVNTFSNTTNFSGFVANTNAQSWAKNFTAPYGASGVSINAINNSGPTGTPDGFTVFLTNAQAASNSGNPQTAVFWHQLNNPGAGLQAFENVLDIQGNANWSAGHGGAAAFYLNLTAITSIRQFNTLGTSDSLWFTSCSPDINYSSTPDPAGITHTFTEGSVRIGEINYGNAWGDFGIGLTLSGGPARSVSGIGFYPDVISGAVNDPNPFKFNVTWGAIIGAAAADHTGNIPKHWIGLMIDQDGVVGKNDHGSIIGGGSAGNSVGGGGYAFHINGSSSSGNPIGKGINFDKYMDIGLDVSGATCTQTGTNCPSGGLAIVIAQNQAIKMGTNTFLYFDGSHLKFVLNGAAAVTIV